MTTLASLSVAFSALVMLLTQWPQVMSLTSKVIIAYSSETVGDGRTVDLPTVGMSTRAEEKPYAM